MELIFLGPGAADWKEPKKDGEYRGFTSTLIDGEILLDCTAHTLKRLREMQVDWARISAVFFTHSHSDHCNPEAAGRLAEARRAAGLSPLKIYGESSWIAHVFTEGEGYWQLSALEPFQEVCLGAYRLLPLPSNHSSDYRLLAGSTGSGPAFKRETTLHYLLQAGGKAVLYALDGAWMLTGTWEALHGRQLDAWVVDCTIGPGHAGDYRIFEHNDLSMVQAMAQTLMAVTPYGPPVLRTGAPIVLNHLAKTLHPSQKELDEMLRPPFIAAYDGMSLRL